MISVIKTVNGSWIYPGDLVRIINMNADDQIGILLRRVIGRKHMGETEYRSVLIGDQREWVITGRLELIGADPQRGRVSERGTQRGRPS